MSTRDGSPVPKAGEYKGFPYYLLFESKDKGLSSFMLDQYDSKSRKYDGMSEQEFFNLPDIQTVRVILSSFKYN